MKKYDIVKQAKLINILASALLLVTGVLMLFFEEKLAGGSWVKYLCGAMLIVCGLAKILGYFSNDLYRLAFQFDFAIGLFAAVSGVLVTISPKGVTVAGCGIIGLYVLLEGLLKTQISLDARRFGMTKWPAILSSSLVLSLLGIFACLAIYIKSIPTGTVSAVALIALGVEEIWVTAYTVKVRTKKKHLADVVVDTQEEKQ